MNKIIQIAILLFSLNTYANDSVIFANGDGTYTYFGQTYSLAEFPMDKVVIVQDTVQIFPAANLNFEQSLISVKPLARKFIRSGYKVETKIAGKVIPYLVKKLH